VLRVDQINRRTRLEHYQHLGRSLDWCKEQDGLLDAIIQNPKPVLSQTRHKRALAVEDAHVNFNDLGCGLNSSLRSTSGLLGVQSEYKTEKKVRHRDRNYRKKSTAAKPTEYMNQSRCRANPSTSR
jgi:hypothetical protein